MVSLEIRQRTGYITLQREEKKNALNAEMVSQLIGAFNKAYSDEECKLIVLKAEGDVFSAGADLAYLKQLQNNTFQENLEDSMHLASLFKLIYNGPKMVVAAIQGHAIAGGCGLATVCDFSFALSKAKFGYTEVKIGFIPAIVSFFLLRKIGEGAAKDLLLSGRLIEAAEAQRMGLINRVVDEDLPAEVDKFCLNIVEQCSMQSINSTKSLISEIYNKSLDEALDLASNANAKARASVDCKKGIQSFLDKEPLKW